MKKLLAAILICFSTVTTYAQYQNNTIKVGQKAPELAYKSPNDKLIKLSEVNKGRVVLLDFWASWCGPCRRSNPALVAMYKKYSTQKFKGAKNGFTVVSVSLDQNKNAWLAAIQKDGLSWTNHMSDLGGWQSEAARTYGVEYIPQSFLLDPSGKVLGTFNTAEEADASIEKLVQK